MSARNLDRDRLVVLGWTDDIPDLLAACDVLVTNAGGVTSLEAVACERPVLMHEPIAAHGRANAHLMEKAGLAKVCIGPGTLTVLVRKLLANPQILRTMQRCAREHNTRSVALDDLMRDLYSHA